MSSTSFEMRRWNCYPLLLLAVAFGAAMCHSAKPVSDGGLDGGTDSMSTESPCMQPGDCVPPMSTCRSSTQLMYYTAPVCQQGKCRWTEQLLDCACRQGGCLFTTTAGGGSPPSGGTGGDRGNTGATGGTNSRD
jgi:hypothetical protein